METLSPPAPLLRHHPSVSPLPADELLKRRLARMRWQSIEENDRLLIAFEANFAKRKGEVRWARHAADVVEEIRLLLKGHSGGVSLAEGPWTRELNLAVLLQAAGIGTGDEPSIAIGEADYAAAEPAAVLLTGRPAHSPAPVRFLLLPVDRMVPSPDALALLLSHAEAEASKEARLLLAPSGQRLVICFFDNGRSAVMAEPRIREALRCINCRACAPATGDGTLVPDILTLPFRKSFPAFIGQCFMHPPDGVPASVCPVKIDFRKLLLHNRKLAAGRNLGSRSKLFYFLWQKAVLKKGFSAGLNTLPYFNHLLFNKSANGLRTERKPAPKSFGRLWQERMKMGKE
jgi:L-lactate utilization protein LutB